MRYTTQQLTDLRAAIAEGAREISANGRRVVFRDQAEMLQLEQMMSAELEAGAYKPARILGAFRRA